MGSALAQAGALSAVAGHIVMPDNFNQFREQWRERWGNLYETQRDLIRLAVAALLLLVLGYAGYLFLREPLREWRGRKALAQAESYLEQGEYRSALLALKRATLLTPNDPATWRVVAGHLDRLGLPESLVAHENLAQLEPDDPAQQLALARQALRFDNPRLAAEALARMPEKSAAGAEYHRIAAALALATGEDELYVEALRALLAIEPRDPLARFNLAVVNLWRDDPAKNAAARRVFHELLQEPEVRLRAAVELLKDAARQRDPAAAETVGRAIDAALPTPPDVAALPDGWPRLRAKLLATAESPAEVVLLAGWLGSIGQATEALAWVGRLPAPLQSDAAVADLAVTLSAQSGSLPQLANWLEAGGWGAVPSRVIELAVRSRRESSREAWLQAIVQAKDSAPALRALARLALIWDNPAGATEALEALLRLQPRDEWTCHQLEEAYLAQERTMKLWELYDTWREFAVERVRVTARWWMLSTVLNRLSPDAQEGVARFAEKNDSSALAAAAQSAVWWRLEQFRDAWAVLNALSPEQRDTPAVIYWLALTGAAVGDEHAAEMLEAARSLAWLPEERALLDQPSPSWP